MSKTLIARFRENFSPGLTVFLVAVPLCLGIALASGVPLFSGLISGIIGGVIIGSLSGSHLSVSGPAAGLTAIILAAVAELGGVEPLFLAVVLAGALQVILGISKAGTVARFFPSNVIKGMLAAIGLILVIKQFPHLVGYDVENFGVFSFLLNPQDMAQHYPDAVASGGEHDTFTVLAHALQFFHPGAALIGVISLVFLILWGKTMQKKYPLIPGSLVMVILGVVLNAVFKAAGWENGTLGEAHRVALPVFNSAGEFFGSFMGPSWDRIGDFKVWKVAITIAIVASIETLLSLDAIDRLDPRKRRSPPNQELFAQGVGNLLAGMIGGLPMTSVVVRSSVNLESGATHKTSAILHGLLILISVLALSSVLNMIPIASLAALLVYTGFKLSSLDLWKSQYQKGWVQFLPFATTVIVILFTDLLIGIFVGLMVAGLFILKNSYENSQFKIEDMGKRKRIYLGLDTSFLQKAKLSKYLEGVPDGSIVELDGSEAKNIDPDVIDVIENFQVGAQARGIQVVAGGIAGVEAQPESAKVEMHEEYTALLKNNREWVNEKLAEDSKFFERHATGQTPKFLVISCADSRVPIETITKMDPGNIFSHRNVANIVSFSDINALSVIQYSVEVLNVRHIIVCGHTGCGGIKAALSQKSFGLIDSWISDIKLTYKLHELELKKIDSPEKLEQRVIELNVLEQVRTLMKMPVIQVAREKFGFPMIHGWVYEVHSGKIKDLDINLDLKKDINPLFHYRS